MKTLRITLLLLISSFCIKLYGQSEPLQYKCDTIITVANNIQKGQIRLAPAIGGFLYLNISENTIDLSYGSEINNATISLKINNKSKFHDDYNSNKFTYIYDCIESRFNDNITLFINNNSNKITIFIIVNNRLYIGALKNHPKYTCGVLIWSDSFRGLSSELMFRPNEQNIIFSQLEISDFSFLYKQN